MKLDGFQLQQAIREARADRDQAANQFTPSLTAFPGEKKPHPKDLAVQFQAAEERLARLQTAQNEFNSRVKVSVHGEEMTLLQAIKLVGGAGRLEKMWRTAATPKQDRYASYSEDTRQADVVVANRQVSFDEAAELARAASKHAAALRAAIAKGNAQEVEFDSKFLQSLFRRQG